MQYHGANYSASVWDVYWFEKNLQGDIVAIYNSSSASITTYQTITNAPNVDRLNGTGYQFSFNVFDIAIGIYDNIMEW